MKTYLVGGAVRDQLLGIEVRERDWLVTGATQQQMLDQGFRHIDPDFPVFKHPQTGEEYALARRETKRGSGYKGFSIETSPDITLEEDLQRRDLTINAMAIDEQGNLHDPYNGQDDLHEGLLRHVSPAFVEDPFRLIRIARFASKLGEHGFHVSHGTFKLMKSVADGDELKDLVPQRIVTELYKALEATQPWQFFKLLGKCKALDVILPGLNPWINGEQMKHGEDSLQIRALKNCCRLSANPDTRLAALLYSAIKDGAYDLSARLPLNKSVLRLFDCIHYQSDVLLTSQDAQALLGALLGCGLNRQGGALDAFMQVLNANHEGDKRLHGMAALLESLSTISARSVVTDNLSGKELGNALHNHRLQTIQNWLKAA